MDGAHGLEEGDESSRGRRELSFFRLERMEVEGLSFLTEKLGGVRLES